MISTLARLPTMWLDLITWNRSFNSHSYYKNLVVVLWIYVFQFPIRIFWIYFEVIVLIMWYSEWQYSHNILTTFGTFPNRVRFRNLCLTKCVPTSVNNFHGPVHVLVSAKQTLWTCLDQYFINHKLVCVCSVLLGEIYTYWSKLWFCWYIFEIWGRIL